MNIKDFVVVFFSAVLFVLSSCGGVSIEAPHSVLSDYALGYKDVTVVVNNPVKLSPAWAPVLDTPGDVTYSIAPDLPAGLIINEVGTIIGKPTTKTDTQTYTITATAKEDGAYSGEVTGTVSIAIKAIDLSTNSFTYPPITAAVGTKLLEAEELAPSWTEALAFPGEVTYRTPENSPLPDGLSINSKTGFISGTPTTEADVQTYTITVTTQDSRAYSGEVTGTVNIVIKAIALSTNSFTYPPITAAVGTQILEVEELAPSWAQTLAFPNDVTYTSTGLPEGLNINLDTGVISGTPTTVTAAKKYTVIAEARGTGSYAGYVTGTVNITVLHSHSLDDYGFSYDNLTVMVGDPVNASPKWTTAPELPDNVSYSIKDTNDNPVDLPSGLEFNEANGAITGTPTEAVATQAYKISVAAKDGGSYTGKVTVNISITTVAANSISGYTLRYATENKIEGVVSSPLSVTPSWDTTFTPATDISYKIDEASPPLPGGLTFNVGTGVISGTPTAAADEQTYLITASGSDSYTGTKSVSVTITIFAANDIGGPGYRLTYDNLITPVNTPVNVVPAWESVLGIPTDVRYEITANTPSLPAGLGLNTGTGAIEGPPSEVVSDQTYSITATASGSHTGKRTATINITISPLALTGFGYPNDNSIVSIVDREIVPLTPTWELAFPDDVTYSIRNSDGSPAQLPTGLEFVTTSGVITGTATEAVAMREYTITATGSASYTGEQTVSVIITIFAENDIGRPDYNFSYPIATGITGNVTTSPIWNIEPVPTVRYETLQPLPDGLNLDSNTGTISGTFAALSHTSVYTLTATVVSGIYTGSTTGIFLNTLLLTDHPQTTEGRAISTRKDLEKMTKMTSSGRYYLTNHIDLGTEPWTPLFSSDTPFTGTLHGNGYAIYNLNIEGGTKNYQGLFAAIGAGATVKNLGIGVSTITGGGAVGALTGYAFQSTLTNITSAVMNTTASNTETITARYSLTITGYLGSFVGGLVGYLGTGSTLDGNSIGVKVSASHVYSSAYAGGLVGRNDGTVTGYTTGSVRGIDHVGGLVGFNYGTVQGYTTGTVTGLIDNTGGLVGYNDGLTDGSTGYAIGYATGSVTGSSQVGGLVGNNSGTTTGYATGLLTASGNKVGGLVGYNEGSVRGYWDEASTDKENGIGDDTGRFTGGGISATRNIVYVDPAYTDGGNNDEVIFDVDTFVNAFALPEVSATWPKLKTSFTVGEQTINFPFPQPTVSATDRDGNIDVVWPSQN